MDDIYILCPEISVSEYNMIVGKLSLFDCPIVSFLLPQATFVFVELEVKRIIARSKSTWVTPVTWQPIVGTRRVPIGYNT